MAVNRGQAGPGERRQHRNGSRRLGQQSGEDSSVKRLGDGKSWVEEGERSWRGVEEERGAESGGERNTGK